MPLAKPKKSESKKDFISRCAGDSNTNKEFPDQTQKLAYCYSAWKEKKSKASISYIIGDDEFIVE